MTTTTTLRPTAAAALRAPVPTRAAAPSAGAGRRVRPAATERALAGTARGAGLALVAGLALTVPAVGLLDAVPGGGSALDVAASLLVVAALDVVVGRGLYLVAGGRARPAAYAALLSRVGHGLLLAVAATLLLWRGSEGAAPFREDWATASLVLAAHLLVAGVALWRSRTAPRPLALTVGAGGAAALGLAALPGVGAGLLPLLVPVLAADGVLAVTLLRHGLRAARWRSWAAPRPVPSTGTSSAVGS